MNFKLTKSSLNFKVYTSPTIPSSGTENDIVIISSTPMENWILSSDAPVGEPRNNGDIWIEYSVSGNVFDVMNQHDFMLAITKIYQYVDRTWVSVNARRYVGGVWDVVSTAFSATINITYPANSTCIVTNSIGQTVASDANSTSSEKTFTVIVNATGTYTVTATATDGTNTKSQSVSITSEGQFESVKLAHAVDLYNSTITSGWAVRKRIDGSGTGSISSGKMVLDGDMAYGGAANLYTSFYYYKTKVECSADKKLKIEVTKRTASAKLIIVSSLADATNEGYEDINAVASAEISGTGTTSLPLVDGSYYIGVLFNANAYIEATRVWIE